MSDIDRAEADEGGGINGGNEEDREWKCKRCGSKGKRPPFFRLRKSKKLLQQKQSGVYVNSRSWGRSGGWCCLCLRQPKTLDSSGAHDSDVIEDYNQPAALNFCLLGGLLGLLI
ncbi:hypothetical protein SASPL_120284 [Salvia splendens]|uniref:Uncharacterized protein n=1 Tax=Salvia splendens TaxID=180675 RepID=A0A8X8XTZ5_SALSN|nr:hypothetical protein SASPL_120284 [Salvia splendens]